MEAACERAGGVPRSRWVAVTLGAPAVVLVAVVVLARGFGLRPRNACGEPGITSRRERAALRLRSYLK